MKQIHFYHLLDALLCLLVGIAISFSLVNLRVQNLQTGHWGDSVLLHAYLFVLVTWVDNIYLPILPLFKYTKFVFAVAQSFVHDSIV